MPNWYYFPATLKKIRRVPYVTMRETFTLEMSCLRGRDVWPGSALASRSFKSERIATGRGMTKWIRGPSVRTETERCIEQHCCGMLQSTRPKRGRFFFAKITERSSDSGSLHLCADRSSIPRARVPLPSAVYTVRRRYYAKYARPEVEARCAYLCVGGPPVKI